MLSDRTIFIRRRWWMQHHQQLIVRSKKVSTTNRQEVSLTIFSTVCISLERFPEYIYQFKPYNVTQEIPESRRASKTEASGWLQRMILVYSIACIILSCQEHSSYGSFVSNCVSSPILEACHNGMAVHCYPLAPDYCPHWLQ